MQETYVESIRKILQNKNTLEKELNVKLTNKGKIIFVDGKAEDEFIAIETIEAMNMGFTSEQGLLLKDEGFCFEKINIKDITKRHDLERVRGRIIGTKGKTKKVLENLSDCFICLHENTVGIIGRGEDIEKAMQAVEAIIQGSKQSKVYRKLERARTLDKTKLGEDLGLKK